jgi:hypothetical protein
MGGRVARAYVEDAFLYGGDVDRLLMLAPPNHGSNLAAGRLVVEWVTHAREKRQEDHSFWTMFTDGLGEAGEDLRPDSLFLTQLNSQPRNPKVRYTIVAGTKAYLTRQLRDQMVERLDELESQHPIVVAIRDEARRALDVELVPELIDGHGDGAVSLESARLEGVSDFEELSFEHLSMLGAGPLAEPGEPPCLEPLLRRLQADRKPRGEAVEAP